MDNRWSDKAAQNMIKHYAEAGINEDVALCLLALARADKTTGAVLTVDGGNIAAALR